MNAEIERERAREREAELKLSTEFVLLQQYAKITGSDTSGTSDRLGGHTNSRHLPAHANSQGWWGLSETRN